MTAASCRSYSEPESHGHPRASSPDSIAPKAVWSISSKVLSASSTEDFPDPGAPALAVPQEPPPDLVIISVSPSL